MNVKMPTIVGILTFISRINFKLNSDENEKSVTSAPVTEQSGLNPTCSLSYISRGRFYYVMALKQYHVMTFNNCMKEYENRL